MIQEDGRKLILLFHDFYYTKPLKECKIVLFKILLFCGTRI